MSERLAKDAFDAIALNRLGNVLLGDNKSETRTCHSAGHCQYQNVLAGDFIAGVFEYGLVVCGTQQTQLLAKAKVRHRFYFRECCRLKGKPITL